MNYVKNGKGRITLSMKKIKGYFVIIIVFMFILLSTMSLCKKENRQSKNEQEKMHGDVMDEIIKTADEIVQKQDIRKGNNVENNFFYESDKYVIYADGIAIVVEGREEKDNFYWRKSVSYMNLTFPIDAYLCDKNGIEVEAEEDAYLYIDFGNLGEWWCDPFENLSSDLQINAEFVPEDLIEKIKERILEGWYDIKELEENTGLMQLTLEELKGQIPEELLNEILAEKEEGQDYFEIDFDNDGKKDIVVNNRAGMNGMGYNYQLFFNNEANGTYQMTFGLNNTASISKPINYKGKNYWLLVQSTGSGTPGFGYDYYQCDIYYFDNGYPIELVTLVFDPMNVNKILGGEMNKNELEVDVTVKKKFVNDFINMSYGPW